MAPAASTQEPSPTIAEVESPIINSPFREPDCHWQIERGKPPVRAEGRRRASYFYRVPEHAGRGGRNRKQAELFADAKGEEVELEIVNLIRQRVREWRAGSRSGGVPYDGASPVTRELLEHWRSEGIGPIHLKMMGRVRHRPSDITDFEEASLRGSTYQRASAPSDHE